MKNKYEGVIYVATNHVENNTVVALGQEPNGNLEKIGEFKTGGKGTGNIEIFDWGFDETHPLKDGVDPLISAYGVFKDQHGANIFVVNPGDGTISSLGVEEDGDLKLNNVVPAGDIHPLSIASHNDLVYVASSGSVPEPPFNGNLLGYTIANDGKLIPIPDSGRDLGARPSCIAFTSDGNFLVVTELVSGLVKVYAVGSDGQLSVEPVSMVGSPHDTENDRWLPIPVGIDIIKKRENNIIFVSEARFLNNEGMLREEADKVPQSPKYSWQTGSTSSYMVDKNGHIKLVSGDVLTGTKIEGGQISNCWLEISEDGKILWAANALSSSISSYTIESSGKITLKNETAYKMEDESLFFSDLYLSKNGKYLNQLIGNKGAVKVLSVMPGNKLKSVGLYSDFGMPSVGTYGLISI